MSAEVWKRGRGKLGVFAPLLGRWRAVVKVQNTEWDDVVCTRTFAAILGGKFISLEARWARVAKGGEDYVEHCIFGPDSDGRVCFWSFTSDGKRSQGWLSSADDISPTALCFEADMDMGRARQVYSSDSAGGVFWTVDRQTKKGWKSLAAHHYVRERP